MRGIHTMDIGIFAPYIQISGEQSAYFSQLPDDYNQDMEMFDLYELIFDDERDYI